MTATPQFASASLLGPDHTELDEIAVIALSDSVAIGLSRGRFPKGYPSTDPNEDGVFAASDGAGTLLAVADGHRGFDAAGAALGAIEDGVPAMLARSAGDDPRGSLLSLAEAARDRLADHLSQAEPSRRDSRTTLVIALITGREAWVLSIGDSRALVTRKGKVRAVRSAPGFLGPDTTILDLPVSRRRLRRGDSVTLGTDGLLDFLGSDWRSHVSATADADDAGSTVRDLISRAQAGGAGDNVGVAAVRR